MNRKVFGALAIAILALVMNVNAQTKTRADVPFSFDLGGKALPAGTYTVEEISQHSMAVRNAETRQAALINANSAERRDAQSPKLVFHKYGETYFLYEVWNGSNEGMEIPESPREKELKMASANGAAPQEVVVALR